MATLQGKITDVTHRPPESLSSITVKAPSVRVGGGTDLIVSSPATVDFDRSTGDVTISGLTGGLSWLYLEGEGWSDSIPLAVAEGMISLIEAIANTVGAPGMADYVRLLANLELAVGEVAQDAVDAAAENIRWDKPVVSNADTAFTPGAYRTTTATAGLPDDADRTIGSFEVLPAGEDFVTQRFTTTGANQETWERSQRSPTDFYAWSRVLKSIGDPLAAYNAGKGM